MKRYTRYIQYIKPCLWLLVIAILSGVVFGLSSGFGMPVIFDKVLRKIFLEQSDGHTYPMSYVIGIALLLPMVFAVRALAGYLSGYFSLYASIVRIHSA